MSQTTHAMHAGGCSQTGAPPLRVPIPSEQPPGRRAATGRGACRAGSGHRIVTWTTRAVLGIVVAAFLFLVVGPRTGAYHVNVVLSNSMQPRWEAGDIVISRPQRPAEVRAGQVITYNAPTEGRPSVTHRVIEVVEAGSAPVVRTKGDANTAPDEWGAVRLTHGPVQKVTGAIPNLGWVVAFLQSRAIGILTTLVAPILLMIVVLWRIWRPAGSPDEVAA